LGWIDGFIVALNLAIAVGGIDLDAAMGVPLGEQLVGWSCFGAVGDADHGGGFYHKPSTEGKRSTIRALNLLI
jgi:hypothetical protein